MTLNDVINREGTGPSGVGRRREGKRKTVRGDSRFKITLLWFLVWKNGMQRAGLLVMYKDLNYSRDCSDVSVFSFIIFLSKMATKQTIVSWADNLSWLSEYGYGQASLTCRHIVKTHGKWCELIYFPLCLRFLARHGCHYFVYYLRRLIWTERLSRVR